MIQLSCRPHPFSFRAVRPPRLGLFGNTKSERLLRFLTGTRIFFHKSFLFLAQVMWHLQTLFFDVTMRYDRGLAPFTTLCFMNFMRTYSSFPISELTNSSRPNLRSTFLSLSTVMTTFANSSFTSFCLVCSLLDFPKMHGSMPHVLWIQLSRMKSLFVTLRRLCLISTTLSKVPSSEPVDLLPLVSCSMLDDFSVFETSMSSQPLHILSAISPSFTT